MFLLGDTEGVWDKERALADFMAFQITADGIIELLRMTGARQAISDCRKKPKYHIYCLEDSSRAGIANGVATVISSVFPVLPVMILFFVPRLVVRLVLIVFTVGFAAVLVFGMNVNSEKVLAITTAPNSLSQHTSCQRPSTKIGIRTSEHHLIPLTCLLLRREEGDHSEDGKEHHGGSTQTVDGASVVGGADAALEVDMASSSLRGIPYNEHDMGSAETDNLQRANQTEPVVNTNVSDEHPLSIAESSRQTLVLTTVSASSLPDLGEGGPVVIDISNFTAAKILDEQPSPSGVEYRCEFEPRWLGADLVEKAKMGRVRIRNYKNGLIQANRLGTLRERKRKLSQM